MHELSERAELVRLHGRAQAIPSSEIDRILLSIDSLDDDRVDGPPYGRGRQTCGLRGVTTPAPWHG